MTARLDLERIVTDWLQGEASSSGSDRVLSAALVRVSSVRQERRRPTWRLPPSSPVFTVATTVAAVIAVAFSVGLLTSNRDNGRGVTIPPTPVPTQTPTPATPASPCPRPAEQMAPGQYVVTDFPSMSLRIAMPDSWLGGCWEVTAPGRVDRVWSASFVQDRAEIGANPGGIGITTADPVPPICAGFPTWDRAEVSIDGFTGERFDYNHGFAQPFVCHPNYVVDQLGEGSGRGPETLLTLWMLDVNGERLTMFAWIKALDHARQAELQQIMESMQIEPIGGSGQIAPPRQPTPRGMDEYVAEVRSTCATQFNAIDVARRSLRSGGFPLGVYEFKHTASLATFAVDVTEEAIDRLRSLDAPTSVRPYLEQVYEALEAPLAPLRAIPAAVDARDRQQAEDLATQHFLIARDRYATLRTIAMAMVAEAGSGNASSLADAFDGCPAKLR